MTSCADVRENISAYADNELDINERQLFEEHIKNCPSCKEELEVMLQIISICKSMPQQELPAGFKDDLHEKLTAISVRQQNIHVIRNKPKKTVFARTIASIAAGVLLIFLGGSIVRFGLFSENFMSKNSKSSDMAPMTAPEAASAAPAEAAGEGSIAYSLNEASDTNGILAMESAADYDSSPANRSYGIMENEKPLEAPVKSFATNRSEAKDIRDNGSGEEISDETISSKSSTITITAKDTAAAFEKLALLASVNNGISADDSSEYGAMQENQGMAIQSSATDEAQVQKQVQFVFTEADYSTFTAALNETFGAADVQTGAFVAEDMTNAMNALIDQSDKYDNDLQKLQKDNDVKNAEDIESLRRVKESIDEKIEKIRLNSDFVTVTVYVNMK